MATIGMLYICTGKYTVFWPEFYETFSRNFLPGCKKEYFVFTDAPSIAHEDDPAVHRIDQPAYDWPLSTMKRFAIFLTQEKALEQLDYLFFFNPLFFSIIKCNEMRNRNFQHTSSMKCTVTKYLSHYI